MKSELISWKCNFIRIKEKPLKTTSDSSHLDNFRWFKKLNHSPATTRMRFRQITPSSSPSRHPPQPRARQVHSTGLVPDKLLETKARTVVQEGVGYRADVVHIHRERVKPGQKVGLNLVDNEGPEGYEVDD